MSRIGKQIIAVPSGVELNFEPLPVLDSVKLTVKGPLGVVSRIFKNDITFKKGEDGSFTLLPAGDSIYHRALWGTYASHLINMIEGVTKGFSKKLTIEGIGYKADVVGGKLVMSLGFSHQVPLEIPSSIKVMVEKGVVVVSGCDKDEVGQYAAEIVSHRPPEPYKGKGILYEGQVIRRKQGKKTVA